MIQDSLEDIRKKVEKLASKLNVPTNLLPTYGYSRGDAYPHIEVDKAGLFHYVVIERGYENSRQTTDDLDELLYWIFSKVTFRMASDYELKNRIEDKDCRRIIFQKEEELLGVLCESWRLKRKEENRKWLVSYPFDDLASIRATYCGQLRAQGYSESEIKELAFVKFPINK